jgi:hypothetical protein
MLSIVRELRIWPELQFAWGGNHALIEQTRSIVATKFLEGKLPPGDVLFMVDHDISWQAGDVRALAIEALALEGIVSGVYSGRRFGGGTPIRSKLGSVNVNLDRRWQAVEATLVPGGFLAINREVLAGLAKRLPRMKPKFSAEEGFIPFFHTEIVEGELLSEDWAFCHRVSEAGFPIWAHFGPELVHTGEYGFRLEDSIRKMP